MINPSSSPPLLILYGTKYSSKYLLASDQGGESIFLEQPENEYLKNAFNSSEFYKLGQRWHNVVRLALELEGERRHMFEKILKLIIRYASMSREKYFQLRTRKNEQIDIPPLTDFNRLQMVSKEYWEIYNEIKNQINFNNKKKRELGIIRGKINWTETIKKSSSKFPIEFVTSSTEREFVMEENILLIICARWLNRESSRLLRIPFKTKLEKHDRDVLKEIYNKSEVILLEFPFKDVVKKSKIYWDLEFNHSKINHLENITKKRIREKRIRNQNYSKLLTWINAFRELSIQRISGKSSSEKVLRSLKHVDEMFEVWIFLEFVDYLNEKELLINCEFGKHPRCQFKDYSGNVITFWYEKWFNVGQEKSDSWAVIHKPDFTAMFNDEVIAVFDAKNYTALKEKEDNEKYANARNKLLAYMNNLNTNCGVVIFPEHPKNWDEMNEDERITMLGEKLQNIPKGRRRNKEKLSWIQLDSDIKEGLQIGIKKQEYSRNGSISMTEKKMFAECKMRPGESDEDQDTRKITNESLDFIFKSIVERIPIPA